MLGVGWSRSGEWGSFIWGGASWVLMTVEIVLKGDARIHDEGGVLSDNRDRRIVVYIVDAGTSPRQSATIILDESGVLTSNQLSVGLVDAAAFSSLSLSLSSATVGSSVSF